MRLMEFVTLQHRRRFESCTTDLSRSVSAAVFSFLNMLTQARVNLQCSLASPHQHASHGTKFQRGVLNGAQPCITVYFHRCVIPEHCDVKHVTCATICNHWCANQYVSFRGFNGSQSAEPKRGLIGFLVLVFEFSASQINFAHLLFSEHGSECVRWTQSGSATWKCTWFCGECFAIYHQNFIILGWLLIIFSNYSVFSVSSGCQLRVSADIWCPDLRLLLDLFGWCFALWPSSIVTSSSSSQARSDCGARFSVCILSFDAF